MRRLIAIWVGARPGRKLVHPGPRRPYRVLPIQAHELQRALARVGVAVELLIFPRETHAIQEPKHNLAKMRRELAFFTRHLLDDDRTADFQTVP